MQNIPIRAIRASSKEPASVQNFCIRHVHDLLAGKDMHQAFHRHDFYYILVLNKGAGHHEIDFTSYKIGDHSIFFMRPGQVHQLTLKAGSKGFLMEFNAGFFHPLNKAAVGQLRKAGSINYYQLAPTAFKKIQSLLANTSQEYIDQQEGFLDIIQANLHILIIELARLNNQGRSQKAGDYSQDRLEVLLALIEKYGKVHKQVAQYAAMMNVSPFQLNSITKTMLGKTCSALINEYMILESKRYLLSTTNQVSQIADLLGYDDVSYFIRFFKKHTSLSPEQFRQNYK